MSDAGSASRDWRFYVKDMIGFCRRIEEYTAGLDQAGFVARHVIHDATMRNLELIGEAATHIPETVRNAHPDIPWRAVASDHRDTQPPDSWLFGHRQRYRLGHHP